ncbi:MAG: RNA polymerase binding protein DksA [uncultured bacterium]|nr:MAG: RNA polymerase binding protein DksA [uncultured bacterium]
MSAKAKNRVKAKAKKKGVVKKVKVLKKSVKSKPASAKKKIKPVQKSLKKSTAKKKTLVVKKLPKKKIIAKTFPKKTVKAAGKPVVKKVQKSNVTLMTDFVKEQNKKTQKSKEKVKSKAPKTPKALSAELSMVGLKPYDQQPDEEYMNESQQEHFSRMLGQWKQELMQEVDRTVHHMQDEAANFPDPNDRATQEEEFSLELRARDRERKLIKKIEEALAKIEQGEYGYCEGCGIEIGVRRLEARPTATLCIDCKTLDEIKERQMGNV